jgi:cyclic pyranopterin phosphate synthase
MFAAMADTRLSLTTVLDGIRAAKDAGLSPVKLNAVVRRGHNDDGILELADFARTHGHVLRFIEYMDVGDTNNWVLDDVVPSAEILARIGAVFPIESMPPARRGEVAKRWRYVDGAGEIGVISSVTQPFCTDCSRARVTSTGELFTCLFGSGKSDLRAMLRGGASDAELLRTISGVWSVRRDRYSEAMRGHGAGAPRAEMSYLGG